MNLRIFGFGGETARVVLVGSHRRCHHPRRRACAALWNDARCRLDFRRTMAGGNFMGLAAWRNRFDAGVRRVGRRFALFVAGISPLSEAALWLALFLALAVPIAVG